MEPSELAATGATVLTSAGGAFGLIRLLLGNTLKSFEKSIAHVSSQVVEARKENAAAVEKVAASVKEGAGEFKSSIASVQAGIDSLKSDFHLLREQHIGHAKDIARIDAAVVGLVDRQNGMSGSWKEQHEKIDAKVDALRLELYQRIDDLLVPSLGAGETAEPRPRRAPPPPRRR